MISITMKRFLFPVLAAITLAVPARVTDLTGFLYSNGTFTTGIGTIAFGTNNSGRIVGVIGNPYQYGFLYSNGVYTTLNFPGATQTWATDINDPGQIVGSYSTGNAVAGFLYSNGIYTTISFPLAGSDTWVWGINNSGLIVGTINTGHGEVGFIYSNGNFTILSDPLASPADFPDTQAFGINNSGEVVGRFRSADGTAGYGFLYSSGIYTTLSAPEAATNTWAYGINDRDEIVGVAGNSSFLYDNGTYSTIGFGLEAFDINNRGDIVGDINEGTFPTGVPEPSTWAMMLLGFAGLGFAFQQSRRADIKHNISPATAIYA
jgi:hypothetical protein